MKGVVQGQLSRQTITASVQAFEATIGSMEGRLLELNQERATLDSEYAKLPVTAGKTISQRRRKVELETQIGKIQQESSSLRLRLKAADVK